MEKRRINIVGGGLAGSEAAWQISRYGVPVRLFEMKPQKKSPAHTAEGFAELVCSNSLRSDRLSNAAGLLKEELRRMNSLVMRAADETRVPAGGALAVNRNAFSEFVTRELEQTALVEIVRREVRGMEEFSPDEDVIVTSPS